MSSNLQPLIDTTAWNLMNRRTPFLARAVYQFLEAGRSPLEVIHEVRSSCSDELLRPLLACAVHGCEIMRGFSGVEQSKDVPHWIN